MYVTYWPNFHRLNMCVRSVVVVVVMCVCRRSVATQSITEDTVVRLLLSAETGDDQCSLQTVSNYSGRCHCSSLFDVQCSGLDRIPRFVSNESDRIFKSINMADQAISEVPPSAFDGLQVG